MTKLALLLTLLVACNDYAPKPSPVTSAGPATTTPKVTATPTANATPPPAAMTAVPVDEEGFKALHQLKADQAPAPRGEMLTLSDGSRAYLSLPDAEAPLPALVRERRPDLRRLFARRTEGKRLLRRHLLSDPLSSHERTGDDGRPPHFCPRRRRRRRRSRDLDPREPLMTTATPISDDAPSADRAGEPMNILRGTIRSRAGAAWLVGTESTPVRCRVATSCLIAVQQRARNP